MQTFVDVHRWANIKMVNYIVRPRQNHSVAVTDSVVGTLHDSVAFELPANNAEARIAFAELTLEHLHSNVEIQRGPVCFVTFAPACCAHPVGDHGPFLRQARAIRRAQGPAASFSVTQIQQMARQAMGNVPFVGMVEAALFRLWGPNGQDWKDWVSWHCHLLTWGITRPDLYRLLAPLRRRHRSIREDQSAVHVKGVPPHDVGRQFLYALKAPQKLYRVEYFSVPWTSPHTGVTKPAGFHTQKDWLRTGQRIRLLDVIGQRRLGQLLFGSGAGTTLVRAIRTEALAPLREWEQRHAHWRRR